jgi:hypothetical protein
MEVKEDIIIVFFNQKGLQNFDVFVVKNLGQDLDPGFAILGTGTRVNSRKFKTNRRRNWGKGCQQFSDPE